MKFLIKIEEAIDKLILNFIDKMKQATPHSIYAAKDKVKNSPSVLKKKFEGYLARLRILFLKFIGYFQHYTTMFKGYFVGVMIYLKSDEFKQRNKLEIILTPIKKFKTNPLLSFSILFVTVFLSSTTYFIYLNTSKILIGTKSSRAPASTMEFAESSLEFNKLEYNVLDKKIFLDISVKANSPEDYEKLTKIEKEIEDHILNIKITASQLPLSKEDIHAIEISMLSKIAGPRIKSIEVKQVLESRPKYFMQVEKMVMIKDINLQLFLEDTKRNRQVYLDFTALANNRNVILFLKDHDVEVRDYLNMRVEPVIPQLPIEEEGRQIIKDKVKLELNNFLKESKIEGKILEIYVDYLIAS